VHQHPIHYHRDHHAEFIETSQEHKPDLVLTSSRRITRRIRMS